MLIQRDPDSGFSFSISALWQQNPFSVQILKYISTSMIFTEIRSWFGASLILVAFCPQEKVTQGDCQLCEACSRKICNDFFRRVPIFLSLLFNESWRIYAWWGVYLKVWVDSQVQVGNHSIFSWCWLFKAPCFLLPRDFSSLPLLSEKAS